MKIFWHHMAIRNNENQKEPSVQALVEVALEVEIRKKGEAVLKRKVCQRRRILQDLKKSHGHVITVDLNIISFEVVIKGKKR